MGSEHTNTRWNDIVALRDDLDRDSVVVPLRDSRLGGGPRELSPKAMRFAEALAFSESWSRISEARNRRLAA